MLVIPKDQHVIYENELQNVRDEMTRVEAVIDDATDELAALKSKRDAIDLFVGEYCTDQTENSHRDMSKYDKFKDGITSDHLRKYKKRAILLWDGTRTEFMDWFEEHGMYLTDLHIPEAMMYNETELAELGAFEHPSVVAFASNDDGFDEYIDSLLSHPQIERKVGLEGFNFT